MSPEAGVYPLPGRVGLFHPSQLVHRPGFKGPVPLSLPPSYVTIVTRDWRHCQHISRNKSGEFARSRRTTDMTPEEHYAEEPVP